MKTNTKTRNGLLSVFIFLSLLLTQTYGSELKDNQPQEQWEYKITSESELSNPIKLDLGDISKMTETEVMILRHKREKEVYEGASPEQRFEDSLNKMGKEGWELVHVSGLKMIFKKRI